MQNFLTSNKIVPCATAASTVTTAVETTAVDTVGYDRITMIRSVSAACVVELLGGLTTTATTAITGSAVTATAGAVVCIEMHRPQYRYIKMNAQSGVTKICGDAVAVLGLARSKPVSNTASANALIVTTTTD